MRLLVLLITVGTALAVPTKQSTRIIGGESTTIDVYPFMANMQRGSIVSGIWYQTCGGALITNRAILSAAHCYDRRDDVIETFSVVLGSSFRLGNGGQRYFVSRITLHPAFSRSHWDHDVAIVHLASIVTFSDTVKNARIAGPNYYPADGTVAWVAGFGDLHYDSQLPRPDQLQHVALNVINQQLCHNRYLELKERPGWERYPVITETMLCAGILDVGGKDACQGDSGGPLVHEGDIIIGVTSWGFRCADERYPGVMSRVSASADWIVRASVF